jgi:hypothetical protein
VVPERVAVWSSPPKIIPPNIATKILAGNMKLSAFVPGVFKLLFDLYQPVENKMYRKLLFHLYQLVPNYQLSIKVGIVALGVANFFTKNCQGLGRSLCASSGALRFRTAFILFCIQ